MVTADEIQKIVDCSADSIKSLIYQNQTELSEKIDNFVLSAKVDELSHRLETVEEEIKVSDRRIKAQRYQVNKKFLY